MFSLLLVVLVRTARLDRPTQRTRLPPRACPHRPDAHAVVFLFARSISSAAAAEAIEEGGCEIIGETADE